MEGLPVTQIQGTGHKEVNRIVEDSRDVRPGDLFVARQGMQADGRLFIRDAVAAGAVAVLVEQGTHVDCEAAVLAAPDASIAEALLAERLAGDPSRLLKVVGITGTNGKTTVAHLVQQILNRCGMRCGLIGTVHIDDGRTCTPARLTTPSAPEISRAMQSMVKQGCVACVMEVSSHALTQARVAGIDFDGAVFTNLTGDHMDYHESRDDYIAAKQKLFERITPEGWAVINIDDPAGEAMRRRCSGRIYKTSIDDPTVDYYAQVMGMTISGMPLMLHGDFGSLGVQVPMVGRHNASNIIQSVAVCQQLGVEVQRVIAALAFASTPPGRLERISKPEDPYHVFVDYAHTDDALENMLGALRPLVPLNGRLVVVFGCGGDRDRSKRPRMARVACAWADVIHVTSDNPRTEDPEMIIREVLAGVPAGSDTRVHTEADRYKAINNAITGAKKGDVIVIAGKGHENYQIIGTIRRDFDDRQIVSDLLAAERGRSRTLST
jgi:UDP-N-acetylmuramoyl-L-alanyl-D-glutamate--2,6-diaminopimelate ligase